GERSDDGTGTQDGVLTVGAHHAGAVPDLDAGQRGVRPDDAVGTDRGGAEQLGAGADDGVPAEGDVGVDPGGGRVHDGDALAHPPVDHAAVQLGPQPGQLRAVVHALGLPEV